MWRTLRWLGLVFCLLGTACGIAGEEPTTGDTLVTVPAADVAKPEPPDRVALEKRREKAGIGLLAVMGIAIAGFTLIVGTLLGGRMVRRISRAELPSQCAAENNFWFLRPKRRELTSPDDDSIEN